jgi:hypothetical protein
MKQRAGDEKKHAQEAKPGAVGASGDAKLRGHEVLLGFHIAPGSALLGGTRIRTKDVAGLPARFASIYSRLIARLIGKLC